MGRTTTSAIGSKSQVGVVVKDAATERWVKRHLDLVLWWNRSSPDTIYEFLERNGIDLFVGVSLFEDVEESDRIKVFEAYEKELEF